jgi:hypothetical protein
VTLVALTQEPEVKVRLAIAGKYCSKQCIMMRHHYEGHWGEHRPACHLYDPDGQLVQDVGWEYQRTAACIAAHGGAE